MAACTAVYVAAQLGQFGIGWTELGGELLQLALQSRLLQTKVLNQAEGGGDGGGRTSAYRASAQPRNQLRVAALHYIVNRSLEDAVGLRLRFGLSRHLQLLEGWAIHLVPALAVDLAQGEDTRLLLQLHHFRL